MQNKFQVQLNDPPVGNRGIFLSLLLCIAFISGSAQPRLHVLEQKQSFGKVLQGEKVKISYRLHNAGNQPLLIEDAEVSCDCTSAQLPSKPVLPGDTVTIEVIFDTKSAYGRQDRLVDIHSNDPHSPSRLRFKGTVKRE